MSANLVIVDDHRVFSQGLEAVFAAEPDFEPMAVSNSDQVLPAVKACSPDAVVMDVRIGRASGIDLTRRLMTLPSPPAVVVLTAYADTGTAIEAIRAGAVGFLPKSSSVEQVICAVRAARLGGTWLNAELLSKMLADGPGSARSRRQPLGQLTAREHQVLCLLVSGMDRNAIANQLDQSPNTIRTHIRNLTVKLGCHSAIEAVAAGLRAGLRPELPARVAAGAKPSTRRGRQHPLNKHGSSGRSA
jgi:DNA-binding NarL/FixJ family response regulator